MPTIRSAGAAAVVGAGLGFAAAFSGLSLAQGGSAAPDCVRTAEPEWSTARLWDEAALAAIRRDVPNPPVHARNLFHLSAAMWDAWAAYAPDARGYFLDEEHTSPDVEAARSEAMSYAAYRVLEARYLGAVGASDSIPAFDSLMASLCYPTDEVTTEGDSPAALGNRIAAAVLGATADDGANEAGRYTDVDYQPANPPLVVAEGTVAMRDPTRWQPLQIEQLTSQNGIPAEDNVQKAIGTHWGDVDGFALPEGGAAGLPIDPGPPPRLGDPTTDRAFKDEAVEVVRYSSLLDPDDTVTVDVSPGTIGANPLGTYDGTGHPLNPVTGEPYPANPVSQADFGRALAEFWADGPDSETPPGHWNTIANQVSDELDPQLRVGGVGPQVDRLEWDVKLYLALNGATHDAAVAAWGVKGFYDSSRPISMIRYMGSLGQSSDPSAPSYDRDGLPLVPGLVEVVTDRTARPGARHAALAGHVGEVALRAWTGTPDDPETQTGGVGWVRAVDWLPYQQDTFVTPAFPAFVSGHSTFSRAAAEVLTAMTGSAYFPGGVSSWTVPAGSLEFEAGPTQDVVLQWATYADAADQAGVSRLWGGIHVRSDDLEGRVVGSQCGRAAWAKAQTYFGDET